MATLIISSSYCRLCMGMAVGRPRYAVHTTQIPEAAIITTVVVAVMVTCRIGSAPMAAFAGIALVFSSYGRLDG